MIKKINLADLKWELPAHEDQKDPGAWKKVLVKHEDVDSLSKLMMVNFAKVVANRTHPAHSHKTMEEIFYFLEGAGEVKVDDEVCQVVPGDRIIVPAKSVHEIRNVGKTELKFIALGVALD